MKTFTLVISSPNGEIYRGDVIELFLRGGDGDLAVLAGHIPFVTTVKAGKCVVTEADETEKNAIIENGLLSVSESSVTLLTGGFVWQ